MPLIACIWKDGHKGRASKSDEMIVLDTLRRLDPDIKHQVPLGICINRINFLVRWTDTPDSHMEKSFL